MTTTTSLPLAKELLELGLKIETEKWWVSCDEFSHNWNISNSKVGWKESIPAPSTDELLEVLPCCIYKDTDSFNLCISKNPLGFWVKYDSKYRTISIDNKSLPEALGLMCKYLLTNGYEFNGKEIVSKDET